MGGMIFTVGSNGLKYYKEIRNSFIEQKGLPIKCEEIESNHQLAKFGRMYDSEDYNIFKSAEINVYAVGIVYYKTFGPRTSIQEIGADLLNGVGVTEIAKESDGHFCIIILIKKEAKGFLLTDAAGAIHIYSYCDGEILAFSTSMLAIARCVKATPEIDSIVHLLGVSHCFNNATIFKEIKTLECGMIYEICLKSGKLKQNSYHKWPANADNTIDFWFATRKIKMFLEHILEHLPNNENIYDFTGGYDSRLILAIALGMKNDKSKIAGFFFGPRQSREAKIVEKNCDNLGIRYINYELPKSWEEDFFDYTIRSHTLCDGMENACQYAPILWALEKKRSDFSRSINGLAGEMYRQKLWEYDFGRRGNKKEPNIKRKIGLVLYGGDFDDSIYSNKLKEKIKTLPNELEEFYRKMIRDVEADAPNTLRYDTIYLKTRQRLTHGRNLSTSNQIIQTVSPLWFRKPLAFSLGLPYKFKFKSKLIRIIAEKASKKLADEKMINDTPLTMIRITNVHRFIPGIIFLTKRGIRGFAQLAFKRTIWGRLTTPDYDSGVWFRRMLEDDRSEELLNFSNMLTSCFYDRSKLEGFIKRAKEEKNFRYYGQLGMIITLELNMRLAEINKNSLI